MAIRKKEILTHPWGCVHDEHSRILILGSFPSPKSRQNGFYYGHTQNLFWRMLALVLNKPEPSADRVSKTAFLLQNQIALWDVLYSCEISGADDNTITNPIANDFSTLFKKATIKAVFTTGKKATALFKKLCSEIYGFEPFYLPSTSPANRAMQKSEEFLTQWRKINEFLA
ncbi:MAG: DNA-deoxyinosine glycosylase [Campylobacteraceae bacterium]|jgi:hypoxanthine-DNA glycosylase|nr:DNA-deoxyinosine glycosylase [Campylobacteraceae bacterium]